MAGERILVVDDEANTGKLTTMNLVLNNGR